jgi:putative redox protein
VLHAPRDTTVGLDNASKIFVTAKHPKSFVSLDDADHLLSRRADAEYAARVIASWVARYVTAPPSAADAPQEGLVTVAEAHIGRFAQSITAGRHHLRADEPAAVGGDDSGPGPYDLLLGALGACTAMTLRMYADHKKLALRHVAVQLKHDRIYAQDCADCETKEGKVDRIERVIDLQGDLDAEQRARLMQIANRCPVHRTLQSEISIETRAAE